MPELHHKPYDRWILRRWENITSRWKSPEEKQRRLDLRAADLKDSIVQGKSVAFIKSGQALALRPDLVKSPEYIRELTKVLNSKYSSTFALFISGIVTR